MTAYVTQNEVALEPLASRHNHSGETLEGQETVYFLQLLGKQSFSSAYGRTYASFLRQQLTRHDHSSHTSLFGSFWPEQPDTRACMLRFLVLAASEIRQVEPTKATLKSIANNVAGKAFGHRDGSEVDLSPCFQAVFVSAGWLSMLYEPSHRHTTGVFSIRGLPRQSITRIQQNIDPCLQRPLSSVSLGFGRLLPTMHIDAAEGQTNRLQVSMLAFDTLMRMGKVRINWSDSLGSHLQFDPIRRELTLFRLPSYCALCLESQDQFTLFERLIPQHSPVPSYNVRHLLQEILLSYRVIFGQDKRSRNIFKTTESKRVLSNDGIHDPILSVLCGEKLGRNVRHLLPVFWPETCLSDIEGNGHLIEQSVYIDAMDFPILGPRLRVIQTFAGRQTPSLVRDMWQDRRNPMQWYTFWAVLWIGGILIILGTLQLAVGVIQLGRVFRTS